MRALLPVAALVAAAFAAPALASQPFLIFGVGYDWVPPAGAVTDGTEVRWHATVFGHTVTTADSLADALLGVRNEPSGGDGDADTFDVTLSRGEALPGAAYGLVFEEPGTYWFFCRLHYVAGMVGAVEVR